MLSLPPCLIYNIRKPQIALKLISKYRKPLGCVKPQYSSFCKNRSKNRAKPHHRKPLRPLQHDFSEFFYCHATVASYRIPGELQGLYRERRGTHGRVTCGFQYVSFCLTRIHLACAAWSFSREAIVWLFRVLFNNYCLLHNIKFA